MNYIVCIYRVNSVDFVALQQIEISEFHGSKNSQMYIFSGQPTDMRFYGLTKTKRRNKKRSLKIIRLKRHSHLERWNGETTKLPKRDI